jgi:hypothetical protein
VHATAAAAAASLVVAEQTAGYIACVELRNVQHMMLHELRRAATYPAPVVMQLGA